MKDLEEFTDFYTSTLAPNLMDVEGRRLAMRQMGWQVIIAAAAVVFVHWCILFLTTLSYWSLVFSLALAPPAAYFYFKKKYYDDSIPGDFKDTAVAQLVAFASDSLSYDPNGFVPFEEFRASMLYPITPDHYGGDDLIKGEIDGHPVLVSELIVQLQDQDDGAPEKNNWITLFKGLFFSIDIGRPVPLRTFVFSDGLQSRLGYAGRLIQEGHALYGHYVHAHDQAFSDRFAVYCEDEIEGERFLTDRFREELMQLQDNTGCDVHLSMVGSKVYVAIERARDFFEIDLNRSLLDLDYIASFYKDLYYVFSIIEDLDLNDMLGGGEEE